MENKIILVGNGRSLLGREIGQEIDSFDTVVRFNNFITKGFEKSVGSKTDWWARNEVTETIPRTEEFSKILLRLKGEDKEAFRKGCIEVFPELQNRFPKCPVEIIPMSVYTELQKICEFEHSPLTGTVVIAHLLKQFEVIHVCGFDNLSGAKGDLRHYYSETATVGESTDWHEPDKEEKYLTSLIQCGKIVVV